MALASRRETVATPVDPPLAGYDQLAPPGTFQELRKVPLNILPRYVQRIC